MKRTPTGRSCPLLSLTESHPSKGNSKCSQILQASLVNHPEIGKSDIKNKAPDLEVRGFPFALLNNCRNTSTRAS